MWRRSILAVQPEAEFAGGATDAEIEGAEGLLGVRLPTELRSLLAESNGVTYGLTLETGERIPTVGYLIWPLAMILEENQRLRGSSPSGLARQFLFFVNAGVDGILFGHPILPSGEVGPEVQAWYPIEGELRLLAPSLRDYLIGWWSGALSV